MLKKGIRSRHTILLHCAPFKSKRLFLKTILVNCFLLGYGGAESALSSVTSPTDLASPISPDSSGKLVDVAMDARLPATQNGGNCKPFCAKDPTPWFHPNLNVDQKCNWLRCKGCEECNREPLTAVPTQSPILDSTDVNSTDFPISSPSIQPSVLRSIPIECHTWCTTRSNTLHDLNDQKCECDTEPSHLCLQSCDEDEKPWEEKCTWQQSCSGCPTCFIKNDLAFIPSSAPTSYPSKTPTFSPIETPSNKPSPAPTEHPTASPTLDLSGFPTSWVSDSPTLTPTLFSSKKHNTTLYVNLQVDKVLNDSMISEFEASTLEYLKGLDVQKNNMQVSILEVIVQAQYQVVLPDGFEGIELMTEENGKARFTSMPSNSSKRRRSFDEINLSPSLLIELVIVGQVAVEPGGKVKEESYGDIVFESMDENLETYASQLAETSWIFSDIVKDDEIQVEDEPTLTTSPTLIIIASVIGALVGSLFILICAVVVYYSYIRHNSPSEKPTRNIWLNRTKRPSSQERKVTQETAEESEPSVITNPFPTSINISDQDSFSTISNLGLISKDYDNPNKFFDPKSEVATGIVLGESWESKMLGNPMTRGGNDLENQECSSLEADIVSIISSPDDQDNQKFIIVISAPPGPLGLLLELNAKGPLVREIEADSPLIGLIEEGDIILSVDNVNAQNMDPTLFTKHVLKINNNSQRMIKVIGRRPGALKKSELVSF